MKTPYIIAFCCGLLGLLLMVSGFLIATQQRIEIRNYIFWIETITTYPYKNVGLFLLNLGFAVVIAGIIGCVVFRICEVILEAKEQPQNAPT